MTDHPALREVAALREQLADYEKTQAHLDAYCRELRSALYALVWCRDSDNWKDADMPWDIARRALRITPRTQP